MSSPTTPRNCTSCRAPLDPAEPIIVLGVVIPPPSVCDACAAAEREREEGDARAQRVETAITNSRVSARARPWSLASFPQDTPAARAAHEAVRTWLTGYRAGNRGNLIVYGGVGVGKSGLAWACLRDLLEQEDVTQGLFVASRDLLAELRASFNGGGNAGRDLADRATRVRVLALDDLGAERPTEWARDELANIVERRYDALCTTIITSNYDPAALARRLGHDDVTIGKRIVSRLVHDAQQVRIEGADRRIPTRLRAVA